MPGVTDYIIRQSQYILLNGGNQLLIVAAWKVGPPHGVIKQGIAAEEKSTAHIADSARCMSGGRQHREIDSAQIKSIAVSNDKICRRTGYRIAIKGRDIRRGGLQKRFIPSTNIMRDIQPLFYHRQSGNMVAMSMR